MKTNAAPFILVAGCFSLLIGTTDVVMAGKGKQRLDDQQESASLKRKASPSEEDSGYNFRPRPRIKMASPKRQKASKLVQEKESEKPECSSAIKKKISDSTPKSVHWDYKYDPDLNIWRIDEKKKPISERTKIMERPQCYMAPTTVIKGEMVIHNFAVNPS